MLLPGMVCPGCNAAVAGEEFCEHCGADVDEMGSEATAVASEGQARANMAYGRGRSQAASSFATEVTTADSSREMSVGATLPGESGTTMVAAAHAHAPRADDTTLGMTSAMIGQNLGSYRLLEILGEGGMGRVYLAEHTKIGRRVALKMLHTHLARSPDVVRRFFDEARAVNRILHEHIVEITDFIENDGGDNYFIMEYLRGAPLSVIMARENNISSLARSLSIGVQVTSALSAVHVANIVHRDLKPENIFLTERGGQKDFVKLLDFGIAKLMSHDGGSLNLRKTEAGVVMGTPAYMSPEQASAKSVDHRTDIYALGVILYELCTGVLPFVADNFGDLVVMHKTQKPVPPSKVPGLLQEIPAPLDELIMSCLKKEPDDRPQNAKEIEERLHEIAWEFAVELENFDVSGGFMGRGKRKGGYAKAIMLGLGLTAAAALGITQMSSRGSDRKDAPPNTAATLVASGSEPSIQAAVEPAEAPKVQLSFTSEPPGALVFPADDVTNLLGITPFALQLEQEATIARYEFRKAGFERTILQVSLAEDGGVNAVLAIEEVAVLSADEDKPTKKHRSHSRNKDKHENPKTGKSNSEKPSYREGAVIDPFAN